MTPLCCSFCQKPKHLYALDRFPEQLICWQCVITFQRGLADLIGREMIQSLARSNTFITDLTQSNMWLVEYNTAMSLVRKPDDSNA